jgi:hypothetical protein
LEILRELEGIAKKPVVKGDFGVLKGYGPVCFYVGTKAGFGVSTWDLCMHYHEKSDA